jgi:hypothetical protein
VMTCQARVYVCKSMYRMFGTASSRHDTASAVTHPCDRVERRPFESGVCDGLALPPPVVHADPIGQTVRADRRRETRGRWSEAKGVYGAPQQAGFSDL